VYFQREALGWVINDVTGKPTKKNDHLAGSAFQFMIACEPRYFGNKWSKLMAQANSGEPDTRALRREGYTTHPEAFIRSEEKAEKHRFTGYA
jgi:hypothetical protein